MILRKYADAIPQQLIIINEKPISKPEISKEEQAPPKKEKPVPIAVPKEGESSAIKRFFSEANITITGKNTPTSGDILFLVNAIAESLPLAENYLHTLRKSCTGDHHFSYPLKSAPPDERETVQKLAETMRACGVFSEIIIKSTSISGTLSRSSRVINFISGIWLELYSQQKALSVVRSFAEAKGLKYEFYCNLKAEDNTGIKHELDLMFSVGDKVFGAEIKSGVNFFDYDKYRITAEWMRLIPDRFILLNSTLVNYSEAKCISYFYQYYISNLASFEQTLKEMLVKAIG